MLDQLVLLDIYPARELPIEGVSSKIIFDKVTVANKIQLKKEDVLDFLQKSENLDIVVTFGAGDIDRLIVPIREMLQKKYNICPNKGE